MNACMYEYNVYNIMYNACCIIKLQLSTFCYYTVNICIIVPHRPVMVGPTSVAL